MSTRLSEDISANKTILLACETSQILTFPAVSLTTPFKSYYFLVEALLYLFYPECAPFQLLLLPIFISP
jgi:hypothetical protein